MNYSRCSLQKDRSERTALVTLYLKSGVKNGKGDLLPRVMGAKLVDYSLHFFEHMSDSLFFRVGFALFEAKI